MATRKSRNNDKKPPNIITSTDLIKSGHSGVAGDPSSEKIAIFNNLKNEKVYSNKDSYIVLGRDRDSSDISGYGGKGHSSAHSIDIVVGRTPSALRQTSLQEDSIYCDPSFKDDAARIYLSQKSDIDKYFNLNNPLGNGVVGESIASSAIAIKADSLRLMSRQGTKIVTYVDKEDSRGFPIANRSGVDIIAMPFGEEIDVSILTDKKNNMQPIPKGDNLRDALEDLAKQLDALSGIVINFVNIQSRYNNMVSLHTHISPFYAITVPPSLDLIPENLKTNINIFSETITDTMEFKMGYLNKFKNDYLLSVSDKYINSRYHHLN